MVVKVLYGVALVCAVFFVALLVSDAQRVFIIDQDPFDLLIVLVGAVIPATIAFCAEKILL